MNRYLPIMFLFCAASLPAAFARADQKPAAPGPSQKCSMDSLPEADKRRMVEEYARRLRTDGKASADAWGREQGDIAYRKLVAAGICPARGAPGKAAAAPRRTAKKPLLNRQGKPCTRVGVENQVSPGFGGAPPTLSLVPVCED